MTGSRDDFLATFARERIERGSKSFAAAARLLPGGMRDSAYMLYAWCRYCDDAIDGQELGFAASPHTAGTELPADPAETVARLRERTLAACRGNPDSPVFEALTRVVERHSIPHGQPLDLIEGFAMDARAHSYETLEDTLRYAYHVAGVVGLMMARVMDVSERDTLLRACDLGIAFQLTNIARDVMDDAALGRTYLPADWLAEAGIDSEELTSPHLRAAVAKVTVRLLDEAEQYYRSAEVGIARLAYRPAMAIAAARIVYRAIGAGVRARGPAAWDRRVSISRPRKLANLALSPIAVLMARTRVISGTPLRHNLWTPSLP
ncbi:MAG: phytoene/squalene synthase family protein [Rhizobiales bacterium]|nr:phytoene/squalene synthase family protein [Hyphomicrobiales bacterium]